MNEYGFHYPTVLTTFHFALGCFLNWVRHNYYGSASAISLLTHKDAHILGDKFPQKYVIYNPLSFPVFKGSEQRRNTILCVGRLNAWNVKGFDRILKIWSELSEIDKKILAELSVTEDNRVKTIREHLNMKSEQFSVYRDRLKRKGVIDIKEYGRVSMALPRFDEFVKAQMNLEL